MELTENRPPMNPDEGPVQPESLTPLHQPEGSIAIPVSAENAPNFVPVPAAPPPIADPYTQSGDDSTTPTAVPATATTSLLNAPMPAIADDTDLIEREWVDKAKAIVEHTKADPHLQNKEINKMKADYIQKRYNRQIKINEG